MLQEYKYLKLIKYILKNGTRKPNRTGIDAISYFGYQIKYNIKNEFPLLTLKKMHFKSIVHELLWFLRGDTNIKYLKENNVTIWDEWADENGELGPIYGFQWTKWPDYNNNNINQIENIINEIKINPNSRRLILSAWNVAHLKYMKLPPCHVLAQFYVNNNKLSCHVYMRSADVFLGLPFDIASYALLTYMIAHVTNKIPDKLIFSFGDIHIYTNHLTQINTLLQRTPLPPPQVKLNKEINNIFDFKFNDIYLLNYNSHPPIKAPVAI